MASSTPNVQWTCDNQDEFENLLFAFCTHTERSGDNLLISGLNGLAIELWPGDCIIIEDDKLGIIRVPEDRVNN